MLAMISCLQDNGLDPVIQYLFEVLKQLLNSSVGFVYACWLVF